MYSEYILSSATLHYSQRIYNAEIANKLNRSVNGPLLMRAVIMTLYTIYILIVRDEYE
jgi:hypothetical protein